MLGGCALGVTGGCNAGVDAEVEAEAGGDNDCMGSLERTGSLYPVGKVGFIDMEASIEAVCARRDG